MNYLIQRAVVSQTILWFATLALTSTVKLGHHELYNNENFDSVLSHFTKLVHVIF